MFLKLVKAGNDLRALLYEYQFWLAVGLACSENLVIKETKKIQLWNMRTQLGFLRKYPNIDGPNGCDTSIIQPCHH
jgi:hypothetical protein